MFALSSLPGLSIDTRTSKLVTLSFSTPIGEICVTRPLNALSLNVSTRMRAGWPSRTRPMSASSTLPRTNTWSMSPSVITSVALAPRFRIDDTGLPISTSRVSTVPRIGARMVALATSSAARSAAAFACATCARASATLAWLTASCDCAARLRLSATSTSAVRVVERRLRDQLLLEQRLRALVGAARELDVGPFGFDDVLLQLRLGAFERARAASRLASRATQRGGELLLVELGEHVAFLHRADRRRRCSALMMPFAFDLISIFVIGSTLPVATTDLTIVPRSTVASRDGSTSADAPLSVAKPAAPPTTSTATPAQMYRRFRDFRERVVVTQLVRSPGAYMMAPKDPEKQVFIANLMPARGSWLELEIDKKGRVYVRIDRKRKLPVTVLLRAMGYVEDEQILKMFDNSVYLRHTIASDTEATLTEEGALIELFKKQRPGEPPSVDAARALLEQLFFDPKRYDLTRVGRYKLNARLDLDVDLDNLVLTHDDIIALIKELVSLPKLLGIPEEIDEENPIKDYAAEAITFRASRSPSTSTSTSTSATAACARSAS